MKVDISSLPDDVQQLKERIKQLSVELQNNKVELHNNKLAYQELEAKYKLAMHRFFGKKSEKLTEEESLQQWLFNEAEDGADEEPQVEVEEEKKDEKEKVSVAAHRRKKRGRKPIPDYLPRKRIEHPLPDEEKRCPCCNKERPRISEKISSEIEYIPARLEVIEHVYPVYGPCSCEEFAAGENPEVIQAPAIPRLIPGSIAGPGLLAHTLASKFVDSLPFYRQEKIFKRIGLEISRATMCNWTMLAAEKCADILDLLWEEIMEADLMQMDETSVQVLKEPGREASSKSYMWVNVGYVKDGTIILFHYHPSRSKKIPLEILKNYKGYLQTDGYAGYNAAGELPGITHVGCWGHSRRKFFEADKVTENPASAHVALSYIRKIYRIEKQLRARDDLDNDEFVRKRKQKVRPVLERFHKWLLKKSKEIPPKSPVGSAIQYTLGEWQKLIRYLDSWHLTPDNNRAENAIRPFVVGRKNWLFSDIIKGARASAAFYSLVETAKANGIEPLKYLRYLFTKLPTAGTLEEKRALLPHRLPKYVLDAFDA